MLDLTKSLVFIDLESFDIAEPNYPVDLSSFMDSIMGITYLTDDEILHNLFNKDYSEFTCLFRNELESEEGRRMYNSL